MAESHSLTFTNHRHNVGIALDTMRVTAGVRPNEQMFVLTFTDAYFQDAYDGTIPSEKIVSATASLTTVTGVRVLDRDEKKQVISCCCSSSVNEAELGHFLTVLVSYIAQFDAEAS